MRFAVLNTSSVTYPAFGFSIPLPLVHSNRDLSRTYEGWIGRGILIISQYQEGSGDKGSFGGP